MNGRLSFYVKLIAAHLLLFVVALTLIFFLPRFAQSDPIDPILQKLPQDQSISIDEIKAQYRDAFHLDRPLPLQFVTFASSAVMGDLGYSAMHYPKRNLDLIKEPIGTTLLLALPILLLGFLFGTLLAFFAKDFGALFLLGIGSILCVSLAIFPGIELHSILFVFSILCVVTGIQALQQRNVVQQQKNAPYSQYAEALGVPRLQMVRLQIVNAFHHAGFALARTISIAWCAILVLDAFTKSHGLGSLLQESLQTGDYPLTQAIAFVSIAVILFLSLVSTIFFKMIWGEDSRGESSK